MFPVGELFDDGVSGLRVLIGMCFNEDTRMSLFVEASSSAGRHAGLQVFGLNRRGTAQGGE